MCCVECCNHFSQQFLNKYIQRGINLRIFSYQLKTQPLLNCNMVSHSTLEWETVFDIEKNTKQFKSFYSNDYYNKYKA